MTMSTAKRAASAAALTATAVAAIAATTAGPAMAATKAKTVTGPSVSTPYGPVQVKVTVKGTTLTKVTAVSYPTRDGESRSINARALPALQKQALAAQSAYLDGVSGASWTSYGFATSLQKALAKVGIS